jgi:Zn finger protein HypA/HybF involved in hydrogenase expression
VEQVELVIGAFCGVQVDALQFALGALAKGTILENTAFIYHTPHLLLFCRQCENDYVAEPDDLLCPACLQADFQVRQGQEMLVKTIRGEKNGI